MKRKRPTKRQLVDMWEKATNQNGVTICNLCELEIRKHSVYGRDWEHGHTVALALGGKDIPENWAPQHVACNRRDGHENVTPKAAKSIRIRARAIGVKKKPKGRPLPGTKASGWKHKLNGEWVRRDG